MKSSKNNLTNNTKQKRSRGFTLVELLIIIMVAAFLISLLVPAFTDFGQQSRISVCANNLKEIGFALEIFYRDHNHFPPWDMPGLAGTSHSQLNPWPNILLTKPPYDDEEGLKWDPLWSMRFDYFPEKLLDKEQLFHCPKDNPHPSRVNKDRANAWGFKPYEYSYGIAAPASVYSSPGFHKEKSRQILSADSNWTWMQNLSGDYLLGRPYDYPSWYCNTVAYRHKNNSANFLFRDYHVENHRAKFEGSRQIAPDTEKIFFGYPGEPFNVFH